MKAVRFHRPGGPDVLVYEEIPEPKLSEDEVLVRVRACGINRIDIWLRSGRYRTNLPRILGADIAGEVAELGSAVKNLSKGDKVVIYPVISDGNCKFCLKGEENRCLNIGLLGSVADGGYAEFVKVNSLNLIKFDGLDFPLLASLPVNFGTAWNALVSKAKIAVQDWVLIWSVGSGVGHAALQIAKLHGAKVIATASDDEKLSYAKQMGADYTINHSKNDIVEGVRQITNGMGVDIVFDHIGSDTWQRSIDSLAKGGRMITLGVTTGEGSSVNISKVYRNELSIIGTYAFTKGDLISVLRLAAEGRLKPNIYKKLPLEKASEAHTIMESRKFFGKLILTP